MQIVIARGLKILTCVSVVLELYLVFALAQGSAPTGSEANEQTGQPAMEKRPSAEQLQTCAREKQVPPLPLNPKKEAWGILEAAFAGNKTADRANATRVLGLIRNDAKATKLAEAALSDSKPEVRAAAAAALGDMRSKRSIPKLKQAVDDQDPSVALAAANSLRLMHNDTAYEVYSEVLSKERKGRKGLVSSQMSTLSDPKKMAQLGFEEGIGFVPFAGIGWKAIKEVRKDDSSPVRAAAAKVLADDPAPGATKVLEEAAGDKSWIVRAAALESLALRGDPSALDTVQLYLFDEKDIVRYTAAASTLRLIARQASKAEHKKVEDRQSNDDKS